MTHRSPRPLLRLVAIASRIHLESVAVRLGLAQLASGAPPATTLPRALALMQGRRGRRNRSRSRRRHDGCRRLLNSSNDIQPLALNRCLEEGNDLGQLDVLLLGGAEDVEEALRVEQLLGDNRVGLAVGANAKDTSVGLHGVNDGQYGRGGGDPAVELEVIDVHAHEVQLCLDVVAKTHHFWAALALPVISDLPELVRLEPATVELRGDIIVQCRGQNELELAVEEALLARIQRDGKLARGWPALVGLTGPALGLAIIPSFNLKTMS